MSDEAHQNSNDAAIDLTKAWLSNPNTSADAQSAADFYEAMRVALAPKISAETEEPVPVGAVTKRKSLASPDHILSMIDGKPYKSLKRHIGTHGLTPDSYRQRYNLPADYPMVAPGYSEQRREVAKRLGLGRKKAETPAPEKRGSRQRKSKASTA